MQEIVNHEVIELKQSDIAIYEKTNQQLLDSYKEIEELSKKKPNEQINKFKLKFVNKTLKDANDLLGEKLRPFSDFSVFNEDELPTVSDVKLILSHYKSSMGNFWTENTKKNSADYNYYWIINGKESNIQAD